MRTYFGSTYRWIDERHRENKTRAYRLFHFGQIMVGRRSLTVTPKHIDDWLEKKFIEEET